MKKVLFAWVLLMAPLRQGVAEPREWTDLKGRTLTAEYVSSTRDEVTLRDASGRLRRVPLRELSRADRRRIEELANPISMPGFSGAGKQCRKAELPALFGIECKGQTVVLILDAAPAGMYDEIGGMRTFAKIKTEALRFLSALPKDVRFNVAVYESTHAKVLFAEPALATPERLDRARKWLEPLNEIYPDMPDDAYGFKTLGDGGVPLDSDVEAPVREDYGFFRPLLFSARRGGDVVYLLTSTWGFHGTAKNLSDLPKRDSTDGREDRKRREYLEEARRMLHKENERRREKGLPPKVVGNEKELLRLYFANKSVDPSSSSSSIEWQYDEPRDLVKALDSIRKKRDVVRLFGEDADERGRDRSALVVHVVQYLPRDGAGGRRYDSVRLKALAKATRGKYKAVKGEKAITGTHP